MTNDITPEPNAVSFSAEFTPGPWVWTDGLGIWDGLTPLPEYPAFDSLENADGHAVLTGVWCNDRTGMIGLEGLIPTAEANARLIAAAPALYEALEEFLRMVGYALDARDALLISRTCATWEKAAAALALINTQPNQRTKGCDQVST